jgi:hypothetical protein
LVGIIATIVETISRASVAFSDEFAAIHHKTVVTGGFLSALISPRFPLLRAGIYSLDGIRKAGLGFPDRITGGGHPIVDDAVEYGCKPANSNWVNRFDGIGGWFLRKSRSVRNEQASAALRTVRRTARERTDG